MVDFYKIPEQELPPSMRYFREFAEKRGWGKIEKLYHPGPNFLLATRPDGREIHLSGSTPPTMSSFSTLVADDKYATYQFLKSLGAPQPETIMVRETLDTVKFLQHHGKIVIKPINPTHGNGVTIDVEDFDTVERSIYAASRHTHHDYVLAQQQLEKDLDEVRLICINGQFISAYLRIPPTST